MDVTHFVRRGKCAAYQDGITLDLLDERKGHRKHNITQYAPKRVEHISQSDSFELIIPPTNTYQTEEALKARIPQVGKANFLTFAANWEGSDFMDRLLPRERYLTGYPGGGGTKRKGVYWTNPGVEVLLCEVEGKPTPMLERVMAVLAQADLQPDVQNNILHWLWLHNAMSIAIWAGFAKYREVRQFLKDRPLLVQCYWATKELIELCRMRGVDLKEYPETATFRLPTWLFIILFRWLYMHNESMQRFTAHAADSLQEARASYDAMLKTADELGYDTPNLKALGGYLQSASRKGEL